MRIVIKNGHLMDHTGDHGIADLYLNHGIVEGKNLGGDVDQTIDANQALVTPAFLDLHCHLREPGHEVKENLESGLRAAAAGGFGTVVGMANTLPPIDEPGNITALIEKSKRLGLTRLRLAAALSRGLEGEHMTDFAALQDAGAVMLSNNDKPVTSIHLQRHACEYAHELKLLVQTYPHDPVLAQDGAMNEGRVSQELGLPGIPATAETTMIFRDCEIAHMTGCHIHVSPVSTKRGMQVIEWFKAQGAPVTAEVTPYHLTLTDESMTLFDPVYKVSPPLRTQEDVDYLRDALSRGVVDNIATHHAPHTIAEKDHDLLVAPVGIACMEVAFPLLYTQLVKENLLSLESLLAHLQEKPAQVMGWEAPSLQEGQPADITILDLAQTRNVAPQTFQSKAKYSPWANQDLCGWPIATLVGGKIVYQR
ncbi:MAG: dihydroorotase [Deltaproteobacteria bacterium]|nr:MAG: dihydroorotase [Deltaproteobacteria bacterium]